MEEPTLKKESEKVAPPVIKTEQSYHLSGIIYKNPSSWSLWINKQLFCVKNPPSFFKIKTIEDDFIIFLDQNKKEQTLYVNQTYTPG